MSRLMQLWEARGIQRHVDKILRLVRVRLSNRKPPGEVDSIIADIEEVINLYIQKMREEK